MRRSHLLLCISLLLASPLVVSAQSSDLDVTGALELIDELYGGGGSGAESSFSLFENLGDSVNPRTLTYSPSEIEPGTRVKISLVDYGRSANSLSVNWYVNGELYTSGIGVRDITFTAGEVGTVATIYAEVVSPTGAPERTAPIVIGASHVDMLWEAVDAKVPPFYKGKALPSWDTIVKLYAVPEAYSASGQAISPSSFVYTWEKNLRPNDLSNQSGYGKSSVFALADFTRKAHHFRVSITNAASRVSSSGSATIRLHDSEILLYEKHPLGGVILERALPSEVTQSSDGESLRVVAYPFGLDSRNKNNISFKWTLNNRTLNNTTEMATGEIPLVSSGQPGISNVSVEIKNSEKLLQSAEAMLRVNVE